ncbi:MAG: alpha/beta hydrolase [Firmicutes bacterium]|nr:alpha/beta hydrolase [Bacillota bacterium]
MRRKYYNNNNRKLSYIDFGGAGCTIITLHGHFGCANMFAQLADELKDSYRVISLDQQGHGFSDWGIEYTRAEYINDIELLYEVLEIKNAIIIGHSLGAVNAYKFAAKHPEKVRALVIEDIGVRIDDDLSFISNWPEKFETVRHCFNFLSNQGINNCLYFLESLEQHETGWRFLFDAKGLVKSQINLNGNWQEDWNNIKCEVLLMRGQYSNVLSLNQAIDITKDKKKVKYIEFERCGHTIRDANFEGYLESIIEFLEVTIT